MGEYYDVEGNIIGNFENGKTIFTKEGYGKKDGNYVMELWKYEGDFKYGKEWNGTLYEENGNILVNWVNGEKIKQ